MSSSTGARPSKASILDEDGKLSSASAATSLKYARAQDLPSFPSTGGVQLSSAGAAASLASSNQKSFEHWKPEPIPAANKAALLAKDHRASPIWQPEASAAGSRAAMMAAANPTHVEPMQPKKPATKPSAKPSAAYDTPENTHQKAMMAATAASHNRQRSGSTPIPPVAKPTDEASWAMKAATKSHRNSPAPAPSPAPSAFASGDPGFEAARIQNIAKNNVDRQMYTAAPPVSIEVQEKNRKDTLQASAVAMAQKMYAIQQKQIDDAAGKTDNQALAASRARSSTVTDNSASASGDVTTGPGGYENLEQAARRLAQERLAKIHDEHAEYRSYYGQTSPGRSRLSMRSRRRASSANDDDSDEEQSRKIRSQMSIFQSKLADVDSKKRQSDRDNLLEIAHRNVDKQISRMDEKVFQDTGKASPAQMEKWEKAAREKAQRDSDDRMQNTGKVHIGGGKYLDQSELDAIAKARLQPTLDDISEKAEKQRAKDEEERLDKERKLQQSQRDKARTAETAAQVKAEEDRQKQETKAIQDGERKAKKEEEAADKAKRDEERRLQKEQDDAEKDRKKQEAAAEKDRIRLEKDHKRMSRETKPGRFSALLGRGGATTAAGSGAATTAAAVPHEEASVPATNEATTTDTPVVGETVHDQVTSPTSGSVSPVVTNLEPSNSSPADTQIATKKSVDNRKLSEEDPEEAASPTKSRVKSWMQGRFRSKSNAQKDAEQPNASANKVATVGRDTPEPAEVVHRTNSERDVALAGRTDTQESGDMYGAGREISPERSRPDPVGDNRSPSISSLSSEYSDANKPNTDFTLGTTKPTEPESEQRGRSGRTRRLLSKIKPSKDKPKEGQATHVASNTTDEDFEEARDNFEEEKLAPPPPLSVVTGEGSGKKTLSPKGSRERSKFTEDL